MSVLIIATKGAEDPTGATTPLIVARGLQETGDDVQIIFMAQGTQRLSRYPLPLCSSHLSPSFPESFEPLIRLSDLILNSWHAHQSCVR